MRLATIQTGSGLRPAIALGDEILDLQAAADVIPALRRLPSSLLGILQPESGGLSLLRETTAEMNSRKEALRSGGALVPLAAAKFAAPLPDPGMVLAVGANYHEHLREMKVVAPATPMSFYKSVASIIGHEGKIVLPPSAPAMVDWEGEFSVVIGRTCHNVEEGEALNYVAGYTIINDVSARDWVLPPFSAQGMMNTIVAWEHNILGKLFPTFCPMGPCIVTSDEIPDPGALKLQTRLNGMVVQDTHTSDLVFGVPAIIAYYSKFLTFRPGDVIATGSPSGVGFGRTPQLFMKSGDVIEVEVERIGVLRNIIA